MQTLIVGLGNPILGDDGAGWRIAEEVASRLGLSAGDDPNFATQDQQDKHSIHVECLSLGGLSLMEHLIGYNRAILIDTILTGHQPIGTVHRFPLEDLPDLTTSHLSSTHDTSLQNALRVGQSMGVALPQEITVVAVEARNVYDFSEELSQPILEAVPTAVSIVMELLI